MKIFFSLSLVEKVHAQAGGFNDFKSAVDTIRDYINYLIPLLIGLAVFLFIFGLFKYVMAGGDENKIKEARNFIIFGVIGIAVMISVWGLVNLVVATLFPNNGLFIPQIR